MEITNLGTMENALSEILIELEAQQLNFESYLSLFESLFKLAYVLLSFYLAWVFGYKFFWKKVLLPMCRSIGHTLGR